MQNQNLIHLGKCLKPHGLRGELSLHLINSEDSSLSQGQKVLVRPLNERSSKKDQEFVIDNIRFGNKAILKFVGIKSIEQAQELVPFNLYIKRAELPELAEGEYYLNDLLGLKVLDLNSNEIGQVYKLGFNGVQDILVIKLKNGALEEVPMTKPFVKKIDFENGCITIELPDYI